MSDIAKMIAIAKKFGGGSSGGNAGGGVALVKVSCETTDMQTFTNVTCDKTYAELKTSYDADGMLWCRFTVPGLGISAECACSAYDDAAFVFAPFGFLADSGLEIAIKSDGTCEVYIA